jgi:DnaA-homolog protein
MQQLSLELEEFLIQPDFEHTISTPNRELITYLQDLPTRLENHLLHSNAQLKNEWIYLWGEKSSGKTHILQCMYHFCKKLGMPSIFLCPKDHENAFTLHDTPHIYCIDDVDYFSIHQQDALFNLINQTRIQPLNAIIMTGQKAPMAYTNMREDLRTRLGWGLVYHIKSLNIDEQKDALLLYAKQKKLEIDPSVIVWLQKNISIDLTANSNMYLKNLAADSLDQLHQSTSLNLINPLKDMLNLLDTYSLMQQKAPSIALAKKMLADMI